MNVTYEQFKQLCEHPEQFNRQRQPWSIQITCENKVTAWELDREGTFPMNCSRVISGSLSSDKACVNEQQWSVAVDPVPGACPRFKEVLRTYSAGREITCDDVLARRGEDLGQVCRDLLDHEIGMNQSLVNQVDTGRAIDTCPSPGYGK